MKREVKTETETRDRKRIKNDWRAERQAARKDKGVRRGEFAGKRIERAKEF